MDYIEINKFTQEKKVIESRNNLYAKKINKVDALRLVVHSLRRIYGIQNTALIIHALGVDKIDLSI